MIYIEILYTYTFVLLINEIAMNRRNCVLKLKWKHLKLYIITISYLYKIIIIISRPICQNKYVFRWYFRTHIISLEILWISKYYFRVSCIVLWEVLWCLSHTFRAFQIIIICLFTFCTCSQNRNISIPSNIYITNIACLNNRSYYDIAYFHNMYIYRLFIRRNLDRAISF